MAEENSWEVPFGELAKFSVERSSSGFYWATPEGRILNTNKALRENLGYSEDELKKLYVWDIDPNYSQDDREEFWKRLKEEKTRTFQSEHRTKNGEKYPVETTSHYVEHGENEYEFAFTKDIMKREKAEKNLRKREKKYRELFENAKVGIIIHGSNGEIISANPAAEEAFNLKENELKEKDLTYWKGKIYNESKEEIKVNEFPITKVYNSKEPIEGQIIGISKEEPKRLEWYIFSAVPQLNDKREIERIIVSFKDITERKRAEESLERMVSVMSEVSGQKFFDSIVKELCEWFDVDGAMVGEVQEDDTISSLSMIMDGEMIKDYEYSLQDAPCQEVIEEGPCVYRENVQEQFPEDEELKELGTEGYLGIPIKNDKGEAIGIIWAISSERIEGLPSNWKKLLNTVASRVSTEIERKNIGKRLEESVARFRGLLDLSPDALLIADAETGEIIDANKEAENLLKMDKKEIIGKNQTDIHPEEEKERYRRIFEEAASKEVSTYGFSEDLYIVDSNGNKIAVEIKSKEFKFSDKKVVQGVFHDLRTRKNFQRRKFFNSLLRQDMNNKLGTAVGYLQLLEDENLTNDGEKYLNKAIESLDEGSEIVGLVKEINSAEKNMGGELDPNKLVEKSIEENKDLIKEKEVEIQQNFPSITFNVKGGYSVEKLFKLLLKTRIKTGEATKIRIEGKIENDMVLFSVKDDGKTIPKETRTRMLEETYDGQTFGMVGPVYYVLRLVVEGTGGKIQFKDSELGGERFDIYLKKA